MNNFRRIIVLLLLVVTLLTSCSKNTASQVDEVKLRLNWQPGAEHVAYYLASEKGYYKDAGMNVEIIVGSGSGDSVKLLATGDVDFSLAAGANVIQGVSSGMPIKVIGVIYQDDPTSFTVLDGKGITKLEDLIGKKIGVALNSSTYPEYLALLKRNGIDQSQVTEVPVNFGIEPLLTGQIDAFPGFLTQIPLQVQAAGQKPLVIPFKDYGINMYGVSIVARDETIKNNPDLVQRFVDATFKGWNYVFDHRSEAIDIMMNKFPELDRNKITSELDLLIPLILTDTTEEYGLGYSVDTRWEDTINILFDQNVISNKVEPINVFTNKFVQKEP